MNIPYALNLEYIYAEILKFFQHGAWWRLLTWLQLIFVALAVLFAIGIMYVSRRLTVLRRAQKAELGESEQAVTAERPETSQEKNQRWEKVLKYLDSENSAEWKLAIIEADNILDEMVKRMGYQGENLGERLKAIEPSDFTTLDAAWEGHKIRNQIAHQSDFNLTKREARRVIALYQGVFEEFQLI